jgi:predicted alpha/beta-hydrolase family hydrolase
MHVLVAHGASGRASSMAAHVAGLERRGIAATAIDLPLRKAEAAVPAYRDQLERAGVAGSDLVISGQSYGGRVASLLAAQDGSVCRALVCFSYPLHPPGRQDWEARTAHWPQIEVPVLLLSGESDPFARFDLLQRAIAERLPSARLVSFPRLGHSLRPVLEEALDQVAAFVRAVGPQTA